MAGWWLGSIHDGCPCLSALWNAVAGAIRALVKGITEMMSGGMMGASQATMLPDKLGLEKIMTETDRRSLLAAKARRPIGDLGIFDPAEQQRQLPY